MTAFTPEIGKPHAKRRALPNFGFDIDLTAQQLDEPPHDV
jgi:hypothetical protein